MSATVETRLPILVLALLMLSLAPGYARAFIFGSVINIQAWTNVLLLALLGTYFVLRRKKSIWILYLAALFLYAALLGYASVGEWSAVLSHAFTFAPYIIAFLLLELNVGAPFRRALLGMTMAAACGAIMANAIHWFRPEILALLLKEEDNIAGVISLGRVSWAGYVATLPLVAQLGFLDRYSPRQRLPVVLCVLVVTFGAVLTFNRTLLVALVLLLSYLLVSRRREIGMRGLALIGLVCGGISTFISWWSQVNPALIHLINYRILYFFAGSSNVSGDVSTRQILYAQYAQRLKASLFLGQGLGEPVSTYLGSAFWADVSLVNIAVPFGVCGVLLFLVFLVRLHERIRERIDEFCIRRVFMLVLFLALAVSLNDDIWSHKNFAMYFVFLINSFGRRSSLEVPALRTV